MLKFSLTRADVLDVIRIYHAHAGANPEMSAGLILAFLPMQI